MTRIGLIGAGRWGRNAARTMAKAGVLAWVADALNPGAAVALSREFGGDPFEDVSIALTCPCDAVWICTPIGTHEALVHDALTQNKHVLCEKPLALRREDAVRLAAMASERGLTLMADHTWLGHEGALSVAREGIYKFCATRHALDERGFDPLEDLLPHDVALSTRAMGEVQRVIVSGRYTTLDHGGLYSSCDYRYDAPTKVRRIESWGPGIAYTTNEGEQPPGAAEPLAVILAAFLEAIATGNAPRIGSAPEFIHVASVIEAAKQSRANGGEWVDVV